MKKVVIICLAISLLLLCLALGKCLSVLYSHDAAAKKLFDSVLGIPLPKNAKILHQGYDVGGFLSGTGSSIDVIAYRTFKCATITDESWNGMENRLSEATGHEGASGLFRLDLPPASHMPNPEFFLRKSLSATDNPTYVLYEAQRLEDADIWDWRGW